MARRRNVKLGVGAVAVATVAVGLVSAGGVAASRVLSPSEESKAVIEDAAGQLGVEPSELSDALRQALKNRVDEAVDAGRLTEAQADELKDRIDSADGIPLFGPGLWGHGPARHLGRFPHLARLEAAAAYLDLTEAELREQLEGKTLSEIAKDRGKSVDGLVAALVASAEKAINEAVADGRLTQEQATELEAGLAERMQSLVDGEFREHGRRFHRGFGPGAVFPRGPPDMDGPIA